MRVPGVQFSLKWMLIAVAGLSVLGTFGLLPIRRAAQKASCEANMRTIGLALQNYHSVYGSFPPAYATDAAGNPMHSWRILILPFAGESPPSGLST